MALGPRVKSKTAVRRVPLNLKVPPKLRATMEKAADRSGRSLGAEVEFRAQEYETLRSFVDQLLEDSAVNEVAASLVAIRKGAKIAPVGNISDAEQESLERAVVAATCISKLFGIVAEHAGSLLAKRRESRLIDGWRQRIEEGRLDDNFDIQANATSISTGLSKLAALEGEKMALRMGPAFGPPLWDVCFGKGDPLRAETAGAGGGLMGAVNRILHGSDLELPPRFMPPPPTKDDRLDLIRRLKGSGALDPPAKAQSNDEQRLENSGEKELQEKVIGMLLFDDNFESFEAGLKEPKSDVATE